MYVKVSNGAVDQYPYTVVNLRRDNPNTSFPKKPSNEMLADWGLYPVVFTDAPTFDDRTQKIEQETTPSNIDGVWTIGWNTNSKTDAEVQEYDDNLVVSNRLIRDRLLTETDWWAVADRTITAEQTAYRQALRDITTHANWPHLSDDDWPTKPE